MKMSPLGATRSARGASSLAKAVTLKPGRVFKVAPAGCGATDGGATPGAIITGGPRSARVILRETPGASLRQSP